MRSRFAAFAMRDTQYLWRTLHPDHEDRAHPKEEVIRALDAAARTLKRTCGSRSSTRRTRAFFFLAGVFEKGKDRSFVELSRFARDADGWRYLEGECRGAQEMEPSGRWTIASFAGETENPA